MKCDEVKPACNRCVSTGRICDGYESMFRIFTCRSSGSEATPTRVFELSLSAYRPQFAVTVDEVNRLALCFTLKNPEAKVSYHTEARATLASLSDPAIRHALLSLNTLYQSFKAPSEVSSIVGATAPARASVHRVLEEYNTAVSSLASRLNGEPSLTSIRSALLCCQLFVSVEITLGS